MIRLISHRWVQIFLLLLLLAGAVGFRIHDPPVIHRGQQLLFDWYNQLMPRAPGHGVGIVDIDEESLQRYGQWPWPRSLIGDIPSVLREMGAKAVAFDMVFAEPDRTSPAMIAENLKNIPDAAGVRKVLQSLPDNDDIFAEKIAKAGNVVTGFVATAEQSTKTDVIVKRKVDLVKGPNLYNPSFFLPSYPYYSSSLPVIVNAAAGNGSFSPPEEEDSVIRRMLSVVGYLGSDKEVQRYPALSLEALRVSQGDAFYVLKTHSIGEGKGIKSIAVGKYIIPTEKDGSFRIYYSKGPRKDLYIPAWKVLSKQVSPDLIKNTIMFVGTSAIGLRDLRSSALGENLAGSQAHAEAVEQILSNEFLQRPDFIQGVELLATGAISLCIIFLAPFIGTGILAMLVGSLIVAGGIGAMGAYQNFGLLIDPVYPSLSIITIFILSSILTNFRSEMERRAVKNAFSHYISPALMDELTKDPDKLKLGGEVRELSVMFTDIRNFTTISESMDPADLIKMMNDFLTPMTSCVLDNRGTVDKYMGDAMMAFWNAPLDDDEHARHACTTALQMLAALNVINANKTYKELRAGIGIHTGRCSVGNMGSKQRFAYSALGDTVNLASRMEGQTKGYGLSILISGETRQRAPEFAAVEVDLLTVKGRVVPVRIYALLGDAAVAQSAEFQEFSAVHEKMLAEYRGQGWDAALFLIGQCEKFRPDMEAFYDLYRQRIMDFKKTPPGADWRGVWVAKDK